MGNLVGNVLFEFLPLLIFRSLAAVVKVPIACISTVLVEADFLLDVCEHFIKRIPRQVELPLKASDKFIARLKVLDAWLFP